MSTETKEVEKPTIEPLKVYSMFCSPTVKGKVLTEPMAQPTEQVPNPPQQPIAITLAVVALTSADATRKAVQFFQMFLPQEGITGIEVHSFEAIITPAKAFVVV